MLAMKKIQVLVANTPRMMRELVLATLADQADVEVVGEVEKESEIMKAVENTNPNFLIIAQGLPAKRPPICDTLLQKYPHMRILAIAADGESTIFYWLSPEIRSSRIETSEQGLLQALRGKIDAAGR